MANRLIACATGNLTSSSTWAVADTTFLVDSEAANVSITIASITSPNLIPGAITVDAILLKVATKPTGSAGTITVTLRDVTAASDVVSVTVNISDLPGTIAAAESGGWATFKFSASQTLVAGHNYAMKLTASSVGTGSGVLFVYRTATTNDFSRMLRTTTNAAPGAGDQMIISNEFTGTGTSNTRTVTMDNTASTNFGALTYLDSISVSGKGTLTWGTSASTNYLLNIVGLIRIWAGSTWNQGTSGTRIPSTSTAVLSFVVSVNVNSGFIALAGAIVNRYGNIVTADNTLMTISRGGYCSTSGTAVSRVTGQAFTGLSGAIVINGTSFTISSVTDANNLVLTGSAGSLANVKYTHAGTAATITVASTSGWAANDTLIFAATSQTTTDCESATILSVDSSTQVTLNSALVNQHSGDSPTQAEVVHLTRNVRVIGTSTTLQSFVSYATTAIVNDSYCEFVNLGSATASKRGIDVLTTTGSYTAIGCTAHDFVVASSLAWNISAATSTNISITYSHSWNINGAAFTVATTTGNNTISNCISIKNVSGTLFSISDYGTTMSNCTAVGAATVGFSLSETNQVSGNYNSLTAHSNGTNGFSISSAQNMTGSITNLIFWRNGSIGILMSSCSGINIVGLNAFGNLLENIAISGSNNVIFDTFASDSETIFPTTIGLTVNSANGNIFIFNSTFGVLSQTIFAVHGTADISPGGNLPGNITLRNTLLNSPTNINSQTSMLVGTQILSEKHNQTTGLHKRFERFGTASIDTSTFRTASPAETLTPNNATNKFFSSPTQPIPIDNGGTATVTVYVNKSASYNGNQPRLILKSNSAIGITTDTVLATASGGTGTWLTLTGSTTPSATDDGAFVCYVDCDGTAGTVSVDDWAVS